MKKIMKDEKGFTLVELIVVLVILAILAAILVPALLGYIDRARNGQYLEEAHSIYTAIQVLEDEKYAKNAAPVKNLTVSADADSVNNMVSPTKVDGTKTTITLKGTGTTAHEDYTVKSLHLVFTSQNTKTVTVDMKEDGTWDEDNMKVS